MKPLFLAILLFASGSSYASTHFAPLSCEFTRSFDFNSDGTVTQKKMDSAIKDAYKITIDRSTGKYYGFPFNSDGIKMTVIDYGSSQQSLKIIGVSEKGWTSLTTINVDVFENGLSKPIRFINNNWMYTGMCHEVQPLR